MSNLNKVTELVYTVQWRIEISGDGSEKKIPNKGYYCSPNFSEEYSDLNTLVFINFENIDIIIPSSVKKIFFLGSNERMNFMHKNILYIQKKFPQGCEWSLICYENLKNDFETEIYNKYFKYY